MQNKSASNPYSKDVLIENIPVDDNAQSFETPLKTITVSLHQGSKFCWVIMMISPLILPEEKSQCRCTKCPDFI